MQLFVKRIDGKTVVLEADADETMGKFKERVALGEGLPLEDIRLLFSGKQLEGSKVLSEYRIQDGSTIFSALRLRGGAAQRAKAAAAELKYKEEMEEEYSTWHKVADQTETTGVMRVLCVSMVLSKDKELVHGPSADWDENIINGGCSSEPDADHYDKENIDADGNIDENNPVRGTGYEYQELFDEKFKEIFDSFGRIYSCMKETKADVAAAAENEKEAGGATRYYKLNLEDYKEKNGEDLKLQNGEEIETEEGEIDVRLECAKGKEGMWYLGPKRIMWGGFAGMGGSVIWGFAERCEDAKIWCPELEVTKDPWRIGGQLVEINKQGNAQSDKSLKYQNLERWFFEGVGTTTYFAETKGKNVKLKLWSQDDLTGELGLTDGERRRLADKVKLASKALLADEEARKQDFEEKQLEEEINQYVEEGPCHNETYGIFQWRIKSLKKLMNLKCVFWTNTEDQLPGGSVAEKTKTPREEDGSIPESFTGSGFEVMQFWKYKQKIGIMRKKHIIEDRQRLLDQLEIFTPTYQAVIKRCGADADDDGGSDHYMTEEYQRKITNICALALDTHMPDYEEDKIACMIKTLMERRIGPTWHVLVGRSFGFSVQCEARHFLHLYMQHLAVVVWKSEPDPNAGKKRPPAIGGQAVEGGGLPPVAEGKEGAAPPPAAGAP